MNNDNFSVSQQSAAAYAYMLREMRPTAAIAELIFVFARVLLLYCHLVLAEKILYL